MTKRLGYDREYYLAHREEILAKQTTPEERAKRSRRASAYAKTEHGRQTRAAWFAANPEMVERRRRRNREYSRRTAAQKRAYKAAWYQAHREEQLARARARYDSAAKVAATKRWVEEHPTRAAAMHAAKSANSRALVAGVQGQLSSADVLELWRRQPTCVDCGEGRGLDHIVPLSKGGPNTTGNIANRCRSCNSRKGRRLPAEMAA